MNRFEAHPKKTLAAVLVLLVLLSIAGAEFILSAFHQELGLERPAPRPHARYLRLREWPPGWSAVYRPPDARRNDPLGPVDEQYSLDIDENGFIEPSIVHPESDLEIAFLGGSTTECLYVRPETRFPYLAGRLLEQSTGLKVNAINAGKSGNNTLHAVVAYLGKLAPRRPAYAVYMEAVNDIAILNSQSTYWNARPGVEVVLDETRIKRRGPVTQFIRRQRDRLMPYTYRAVRNGLDGAGKAIGNLFVQKSGPPRDTPAPSPLPAADGGGQKEMERRDILRQSYEPALRTFVRVARAWGAEPVLMTQVLVQPRGNGGPAREGEFLSPEALARGDFDAGSFASAHDFANALVRSVAISEGAILIDLAAARDWSAEDVYDGLHFTETGSRRVAEIVASALQERIAAGSAQPSTPR